MLPSYLFVPGKVPGVEQEHGQGDVYKRQPIVGSTPAGATEKEPAGGLGDRFRAGFIFL